MRITFDNAPTRSRCQHCSEKARWWVSNRGRTRNLCDKHMGMALRLVAMLERLVIETQPAVVKAEITAP